MKKAWIASLVAVMCCCAAALTTGLLLPEHTPTADERFYSVGSASVQSERLEVEECQKLGTLTTPSVGNRCNFVSGQILELSSSGGSASYEVNMAQAGAYALKLAYYTGSEGTRLCVVVNGGSEILTDELAKNGWATAGEVWTYYVEVEVELRQGKNTILVNQAPVASGESKKYVNLDYVELYKKGDVFYYPIESKLYPAVAGEWEVGERIEAEWMTYNGSVSISGMKEENQAKINYVSGKIAQLNSFTATFDVRVPKAGTYAMKLAYFSGSNSSEIAFAVTPNGGSTVYSAPLRTNGWASDGNTALYFTQIELALVEGVNTVTVKQKTTGSYYINFDFIEIYPIDSVPYYAIEHNLYPEKTGGNAMGVRIEAEHGAHVATSGRSYQEVTAANVSGSLMWKGTSPLQYSVYAEEAGEYYLQIVNYCAGTLGAVTDMKYEMTIAGTDYVLTDFALASYEKTSAYQQSAQYFAVTLNKGTNLVVLNNITATNKVHTDFFCFFPKTDMIDEVLQAEHYAVGAVKVVKSEEKYPEIDEFATEFINGKQSTVVLRPNAAEAGYYDLYVRAWCSGGCGFEMSVNGSVKTFYSAKNSGWVSQAGIQAPKDNVYRIYLNQGVNELVFSKNASCYIDLDWMYITKEKITAELNEPDGLRIKAGDTVAISDEPFTVTDKTVATKSNGTVTALRGGQTELVFTYTVPNGYTFERSYVLYVDKLAYGGAELVADDQTVFYNGEMQYYSGASAPEGWTITYNVGAKLCEPGSVTVTVKFTHDVYEDVLIQATFTVKKGVYTGTDLVADSVTGTFDGVTRYFVQATAPEGWDISYSTNGRTVKGVTEVKVVFSHAYYEDVVKTVTITVE